MGKALADVVFLQNTIDSLRGRMSHVVYNQCMTKLEKVYEFVRLAERKAKAEEELDVTEAEP